MMFERLGGRLQAVEHRARRPTKGIAWQRSVARQAVRWVSCQGVPYLGRGAARVGKRVEPPPGGRVPSEANRRTAVPVSIMTSLPPRKIMASCAAQCDRCGPILLSSLDAIDTHRRSDSP